MEGWIKLKRSLKKWQWYTDANALRLLIHLLVSVNYKEKQWRGITIKPGQIITSYDSLGRDLNLNKQPVKTALAKLESSGEITRERTRHSLLITLVKWEEMQVEQPDDNPSSNPTATRQQPDDNPSLTPTKEVKKERKRRKKEERIEVDGASSNSSKPNERFEALKFLEQIGVEKQVAKDFLENRKNKKLSNTETAFKSLVIEINKTNRTPNEIIKLCAEKGWAAFRDSWDWEKEFEEQNQNINTVNVSPEFAQQLHDKLNS